MGWSGGKVPGSISHSKCDNRTGDFGNRVVCVLGCDEYACACTLAGVRAPYLGKKKSSKFINFEL